MIYLDTSVALAQLFGEHRQPPASLWQETLISSRLFEYELWTRVHARKLSVDHQEAARRLLERLALLELTPDVLARACEPLPVVVRTLDALHLASLLFLRDQQQDVVLASYDERQLAAAQKLGVEVWSS